MEKKMEETTGPRVKGVEDMKKDNENYYRVKGLEGMEKNMETTIRFRVEKGWKMEATIGFRV